ncbi:MAG: nickel-dependent hydrogenase large subunit [Magnetococcales bacterium]|nr:nickel-dependent hydrogenase large subunit [Magnetococcales bacterium]
MSKTITIDPVTRLEGHLAVRVEVENGRIAQAFSQGEMFRGFEVILKGRHPLDAQQITQRICGVCPISHGIASILAQDEAFGVTPPINGVMLRNLIQGANFIQSHIVHFYQLSALDFVDIATILKYNGDNPVLKDLKGWVQGQLAAKMVYPAAPFLPRYAGKYLEDAAANFQAIQHYLEALEMRRMAQQGVALFAGKVPHAPGLVPGGVSEQAAVRSLTAFRSKLERLRRFIDEAYLPDVVAVAKSFPDYFDIGKGCGDFLAYGVFPETQNPRETYFPSGVLIEGKLQDFSPDKVAEYVGHSWFEKQEGGNHPYAGKTVAKPGKEGAYSWLKAPRYDGRVVEVGPLARVLIAYHRGKDPGLNKQVDALLAAVGRKPEQLNSAMGRHAARALECKLIADRCATWLDRVKPGEPTFQDFKVPDAGRGAGLTEASRGALGHWIVVEGGKIANYQCVVPTTWNCSPRDDQGKAGALEVALQGTPIADEKNPLEAARVVRSFDPCLACAVH